MADDLLTVATEVRSQTDQQRRSLFESGKLRCPNDKQLRDILSYKAFDRNREFAHELSVVLKCPSCSHIFSPGLSVQELSEMAA